MKLYNQIIIIIILINITHNILLNTNTNTNNNNNNNNNKNYTLPYWPNVFSVNFTEKTKVIFSHTTTGKWYYDYNSKLERIDRVNSKGDRYCGSIHPLSNTPCTHYVQSNGNRWLNFPKLNSCCLCCTEAKGCGIVKPSWLSNATYIGQTTYNNIKVNEYDAKGLQDNYYYQTISSSPSSHPIPVRLFQSPNDDTIYDTTSFSTQPISSSIFTLPNHCVNKCTSISVCGIA